MSDNLITSFSQHLIGLPSGSLITEDFYENGSFRNVFAQKQTQADELLGRVTDVLGDGALAEHVVKGIRPEGTRWVVQMSDEVKSAIEAGTLQLDTDSAGNIFAQLRVAGQFGDKFPITQEIITAGIDPMAVSQALQMKAIQKQLDDMTHVMESISEDVQDVLQGQENDRIALYNSGLNLYLESANIQNETFRDLVAAQAMKSLSDSTEQELQQMRSDAGKIKSGAYLDKKKKAAEELQNYMNRINKSFQLVQKAYMLRAAIYYDRNEIPAMLATLDEYSRFLKKELKEMAPVLAESDRDHALLQGGKWEKRAASFEAIGEMKKQLAGESSCILRLEETAHAEG